MFLAIQSLSYQLKFNLFNMCIYHNNQRQFRFSDSNFQMSQIHKTQTLQQSTANDIKKQQGIELNEVQTQNQKQAQNQTNSYCHPEQYENWYNLLSQQNKALYQNPVFYQQFYQGLYINYYYGNYTNYQNFGGYYANNNTYQQQYNGNYYNSNYFNNYNGETYSKNTINQYDRSKKNGKYIQKPSNYKYDACQFPGIKTQVSKQVLATLPKQQKVSKNQKRRLKKKQLKQQYQEQQRKIGKWVRLQCKQLVQQIKKMEQQDQKKKQRKKQKLAHLIQIHKQIAKYKAKKGTLQATVNKDRFAKRKKLKLSNIKKMKMVYALKTNDKQGYQKMAEYINKQYGLDVEKGKQESRQDNPKAQKVEDENCDEDYLTQSQQQIQQGREQKKELKPHQVKRQKVQQKIQKLMLQQIKVIDYQHKSKLQNCQYNNVKLREWVDIVPNQDLQDKCLRLINRLAYKQAIKKVTKPEKAKKIITAGIHQSKRTLTTVLDKKVSRCIILALNIERNDLQKGTDHQIQQIINLAFQRKIPVIHTSVRSRLGRAFTGKFGPRISVISIINCEGYQDMMEAMLDQWIKAKKQYEQLV